MNKVILMGRLTAEPELKTSSAGVSVVTFNIAVERKFSKDGEKQTDFLRCVAWRNQAEFICKYFTKGSMISVIGNIQARSWDGQDGKKQHTTDIVVEEVYFTGEKKQTEGNNTSPQTPDFDEFDASGFTVVNSDEGLSF